MTRSFPQTARAATMLTLPALIRVVTELDDNGPVAKGMLQRTCPDLTRTQLRYAVEVGCDRGLLRADGPRYQLTDSGTGLADLYDAIARWARKHHFPTPICDFSTRIQATLPLLAQLSDDAQDGHSIGERAPDPGAKVPVNDEATVSLRRLRRSLTAWVRESPCLFGSTATHTTVEVEPAT